MTARDKFIVVALVALMAVISVGAVFLDQAERTGVVPAYGGTHIEGVVGQPQYLQPILAATDVDQDVSRLVFNGLTQLGRDGSVVADLATFTTEGDGKIWTFTIRSDAKWQDGQLVTAADVVYTVSLVQDKAYVGPYSDAFRGVKTEAVSERVVRFTLPEAFGSFAANTTLPLLPAHRLSGVTYNDLPRQQFNLRPIGSGPFRVVEVDARQVVLSRNDDYYKVHPDRVRPYLDRIILRSYPDASAALTALSRGEIDGAGGLSTSDAERARTYKNVNLYSFPTSDYTALFFNVRPEKAVFRDRVVRQAIATAIDKGRVLDVAADGRGRVADELVPPTSWAYVKDVTRYAHSIETARQMLDAADWKDHDNDGVRDKGGVKLAFGISTSDEPARVAAALQIVDDLRQIGIVGELRAQPFSSLVESTVPRRSYDALLIGITGTGDPDPYPLFHSSEIADPGHNFSGYFTLPLDRALENSRRTSDQAKRLELIAPVFQAVSAEVPVVFLYFSDYLYAQSKQVQGLRIMPVTSPSDRLWNVQDWYVKTEVQR
ncbi:MAG TPA: peptide ABC transporter substrate-binding protein [Candidatus Limnocylindria bacterium]|nr:peptide ABC transporter substrate-binding protein [Candidatus Limnocylindria bacterium]